MQSVYTEEQIAKTEVVNPRLAHEMRYRINGSPDPDSGTRVLPPEEIAALLNNSKFREAVDVCERVEGHEKGVRAMARAACKHIRRFDMHAAEQKRVIDMALRKQKGGIV